MAKIEKEALSLLSDEAFDKVLKEVKVKIVKTTYQENMTSVPLMFFVVLNDSRSDDGLIIDTVMLAEGGNEELNKVGGKGRIIRTLGKEIFDKYGVHKMPVAFFTASEAWVLKGGIKKDKAVMDRVNKFYKGGGSLNQDNLPKWIEDIKTEAVIVTGQTFDSRNNMAMFSIERADDKSLILNLETEILRTKNEKDTKTLENNLAGYFYEGYTHCVKEAMDNKQLGHINYESLIEVSKKHGCDTKKIEELRGDKQATKDQIHKLADMFRKAWLAKEAGEDWKPLVENCAKYSTEIGYTPSEKEAMGWAKGASNADILHVIEEMKAISKIEKDDTESLIKLKKYCAKQTLQLEKLYKAGKYDEAIALANTVIKTNLEHIVKKMGDK